VAEHGAHRPVNVNHLRLAVNPHALVECGPGLFNELVVQGHVELVVLLLDAPLGGSGAEAAGGKQDGGQVQVEELVVGGVHHLGVDLEI
jgi:hypothetical protein